MSWLDTLFAGYNTVQSNGMAFPVERILNFTNFVIADDPANGRTNISVIGLVTPSGTGFVHITGGVTDSAARAVNLGTSDVTGTLAFSKVGAPSGTGLAYVTSGVWNGAAVELVGDVVSGGPLVGGNLGTIVEQAQSGTITWAGGTGTQTWNVGAAPTLNQSPTTATNGATFAIHAQSTTGANGGGVSVGTGVGSVTPGGFEVLLGNYPAIEMGQTGSGLGLCAKAILAPTTGVYVLSADEASAPVIWIITGLFGNVTIVFPAPPAGPLAFSTWLVDATDVNFGAGYHINLEADNGGMITSITSAAMWLIVRSPSTGTFFAVNLGIT